MNIYYEEPYGKYYQVESAEEIDRLIREGKLDGPEECTGTVTAELIGKGDPQFQIMGAKIDALDVNEKEFYLWYLLRYYYKPELIKEKRKYDDDYTTLSQINHLLNNVEELDTLLCYDLF